MKFKISILVISSFLLNFLGLSSSYLAPLAARLPLKGVPSPPGSPWPLPAQWAQSNDLIVIDPNFTYESNLGERDCLILTKAFKRYGRDLIFRDKSISRVNHGLNVLSKIFVNITGEPNYCNDYPKLTEKDEDPDYESYELEIGNEFIQIAAKTVWGALRGLETFSQLLWFKESEQLRGEHIYYANLTKIVDSPRFPHRGLMIDTARHYIPVSIILTILDGLSYNKMNVLHWHIVDDQSYPFVSKTFPELSETGAYDPNLVYTPEIIQNVINYAKDLGIRVVLEFTSPGHTHILRHSHPELLTPCYGDGTEGTPDFPNHAAYEIVNPMLNGTYEFFQQLFQEVANDVSHDTYVHLGMDEVYYACWNSSPVMKEWMRNQTPELTELYQVQEYYTKRLIGIVKDLGIKPIVWHDALEYNVTLDDQREVVVQVWKDSYMNSNWLTWQEYLRRSIALNYKSLISSCWYLNNITYGESWRKYYECDPEAIEMTDIGEEHLKLILGGEACLWAEFIDGTNIIPRIFPFLSAVSERLWSPKNSSSTDDAMHRLDEHRCRMKWRGISAQPIFNGYCGSWENEIIGKYTSLGTTAHYSLILFVISLIWGFIA